MDDEGFYEYEMNYGRSFMRGDGSGRFVRGKRVEEEKLERYWVSRGRISFDYLEDGGWLSG